MLGVVQGFTVIGVIIGVGVLLGRTGWLGPHAPGVLNKIAFWVATPALLFTLLARADLEAMLSTQFLVTAIGMVAMALLFGAIALVGRWGTAAGTVGAMTSSYVNSGNLGIPIAVYVLGDASLVVPVMLAQQLVLSPVFLTLLDVAARGRTPGTPRPAWWQYLARPFRNPVVIGALSGLAVAAFGVPVPSFVLEPIELIGNITVPAVLLAFGITMLDNAVPLRGPERGQVLTATLLKVVVHPVVAWLLAAFAFGLEGPQLLAVVVTAALPAAQNIFTYASEYGAAVRLARESILLTTLLSVPAIVLVTVLVHP